MVTLKPGEVEVLVTNEVPDGTEVLYVELADTQEVAIRDVWEPKGDGLWD